MTKPVVGLVLAGGGARAAYQVGVLMAVARMLPRHAASPFQVISGTSAGAINAVGLAAGAQHFRRTTAHLVKMWQSVRVEDVYRVDAPYFIKAFLQETFGFDDLVPADGALAFIAGGRVPIVVVPPSDEKLDRRSATLSTDRTRSPAFALQDHLNEHDETLWGLVTNGTLILRLAALSVTNGEATDGPLAPVVAASATPMKVRVR